MGHKKKKGVVRTKGGKGVRGSTEQLFSSGLIKMWAALKRSEIDQKKKKKREKKGERHC